MKLEHFRYLLEIDRLHSISGAARTLHIRQTTLSAIVKSVEEELGFRIFQRAPTGVVATPAGERFMELAWEISIKHEGLLSLRQRTAAGSQAVSVLLAPATATFLPIELSEQYHKFEVQGNLHFEECRSSEIMDRLVESAANIGIVYLTANEIKQFREPAEKHHITLERLLQDRIYLLVAREHPLSERASVRVEDLQEHRLATQKNIRDDAVFGKKLQRFPRITTFSDLEIIKQAVLGQGMIAFMPGYTIGNFPDASRFSVLQVDNPERGNQIYLCLLHRHERALRYQEKILVTCVRDLLLRFLGFHPEFSLEGGDAP